MGRDDADPIDLYEFYLRRSAPSVSFAFYFASIRNHCANFISSSRYPAPENLSMMNSTYRISTAMFRNCAGS